MDNTGAHSIYVMLGASNHTQDDRQTDDFYATDPKAAELLLDIEEFEKDKEIWECACGEGHLSEVFVSKGYNVKSTDLVDRGYGQSGVNFLETTEVYDGNIITNPPYKYAQEFVEHALNVVSDGNKVAMLLRLQFLEGKRRGKLFDNTPPKCVYVSRGRLRCVKNAEFEKMDSGSAVAYAWFVWEKGYKGETAVKWFN